ncbi:MAG: hypothetical protein NVS3B27_23130 [Novosphingobium sp.]
MNDPTTHRAKLRRIWPLAAGALTAVIVAGWSIASLAPTPARAVAEPVQTALPAPPKDGVMGFVVESFVPPVVQGKDACPHGLAPRLKDEFLATLPAAEAARLRLKANEKEFTERWHAMAFGPKNETNICSQPDLFSRPPFPGVESKTGWGLDLDRKTGGSDPDGCAHDEFQTPNGEQGIDNQEYRAMGCTLEWRGVDGVGGDIQSGLRQFHASGEWTQVLLLRGVTSFVKADNVEVIYANTPDRPVLDSKGHFLPGMSFSVSDKPPRHRNVLHGRIRTRRHRPRALRDRTDRNLGPGRRARYPRQPVELPLLQGPDEAGIPARRHVEGAGRRISPVDGRDHQPGAGRRGIGAGGRDRLRGGTRHAQEICRRDARSPKRPMPRHFERDAAVGGAGFRQRLA